MARIRVTGIVEMIEVPNDELLDFVSRRSTKQIDNSEDISIGNWGGKAGEVKSWILDEDLHPNKGNIEREQKYQDDRKRLLDLSPAERAEESIGYIKLFCWVTFGKKVDGENERKMVLIIKEFFEKNPQWAIPSLEMLYKKFGIDTRKFNRRIDKYELGCLEILEHCEMQELKQIENDNKAGEN